VWRAFLAGDEEAVLAALEAAFEDNQAPAAAVGFDAGALSVIARFPQVDGLIPERYATTTPTGRPTIKKRTKTGRHEMGEALPGGRQRRRGARHVRARDVDAAGGGRHRRIEADPGRQQRDARPQLGSLLPS